MSRNINNFCSFYINIKPPPWTDLPSLLACISLRLHYALSPQSAVRSLRFTLSARHVLQPHDLTFRNHTHFFDCLGVKQLHISTLLDYFNTYHSLSVPLGTNNPKNNAAASLLRKHSVNCRNGFGHFFFSKQGKRIKAILKSRVEPRS